MDKHSATDAVEVEHSQVVDTDAECKVDYIEIVPLSKDTVDSRSSECVSGDLSAEVKQEHSAEFVKQEPDDVCCVKFHIYFITADGGIEEMRWRQLCERLSVKVISVAV